MQHNPTSPTLKTNSQPCKHALPYPEHPILTFSCIHSTPIHHPTQPTSRANFPPRPRTAKRETATEQTTPRRGTRSANQPNNSPFRSQDPRAPGVGHRASGHTTIESQRVLSNGKRRLAPVPVFRCFGVSNSGATHAVSADQRTHPEADDMQHVPVSAYNDPGKQGLWRRAAGGGRRDRDTAEGVGVMKGRKGRSGEESDERVGRQRNGGMVGSTRGDTERVG